MVRTAPGLEATIRRCRRAWGKTWRSSVAFWGWVWWLRDHGNRSHGAYHAGDLWGCVGAWYSGDWHDGPVSGQGGENYILRAENWFKLRPWLRPQF